MLRQIAIAFACVFGFTWATDCIAQLENPATINVYACARGNARRTEHMQVFLNNQQVATVRFHEHFAYKIHSVGRVTIVFQKGVALSHVVDIEAGKEYNFTVINSGIRLWTEQETDSTEIKEILSKEGWITNHIEAEEDLQNPIVKNSKAKFFDRSGTGFLINDRAQVITNFHVVEGANEITVHGINGDPNKSAKATVISTDLSNDLALLQLNLEAADIPLRAPPYQISRERIDQGKSVFALGYPLTKAMGNEIKLSNGLVSAGSGFKGNVAHYQFSAEVYPGNSGGPLLDMDGNVIGVVSAQLVGTESVSYAVKADYLNSFLSVSNTEAVNQSTEASPKEELSEKVRVIRDYVYRITCTQ